MNLNTQISPKNRNMYLQLNPSGSKDSTLTHSFQGNRFAELRKNHQFPFYKSKSVSQIIRISPEGITTTEIPQQGHMIKLNNYLTQEQAQDNLQCARSIILSHIPKNYTNILPFYGKDGTLHSPKMISHNVNNSEFYQQQLGKFTNAN